MTIRTTFLYTVEGGHRPGHFLPKSIEIIQQGRIVGILDHPDAGQFWTVQKAEEYLKTKYARITHVATTVSYQQPRERVVQWLENGEFYGKKPIQD